MRIYEKDPRCWLAEISDLEASPMPDRVRENLEPIRAIVEWAKSYLAQPHPELGRSGPVCPFVRPAMVKGTMYYTVWRGADLDPAEVESVVRSFRDWFLELEPVEGRDAQYKSINVIFPDLPREAWGELIEGTQERLKPLYSREGIMIGEFHSGPPNKAGLWNDDFRPLNSPIPLLSIRHMVATDFAFLKDRKDFMEAYLAAFGDKVPNALAKHVFEAQLRFGLAPGEDGDGPEAASARAEAEAGARAVAQAVADAAAAHLAADAAADAAAAAAAAGCPYHAALAAKAKEAGCPAHGAEATPTSEAGGPEKVAVPRIVSGGAPVGA